MQCPVCTQDCPGRRRYCSEACRNAVRYGGKRRSAHTNWTTLVRGGKISRDEASEGVLSETAEWPEIQEVRRKLKNAWLASGRPLPEPKQTE